VTPAEVYGTDIGYMIAALFFTWFLLRIFVLVVNLMYGGTDEALD
jgi:hypothetical protein